MEIQFVDVRNCDEYIILIDSTGVFQSFTRCLWTYNFVADSINWTAIVEIFEPPCKRIYEILS